MKNTMTTYGTIARLLHWLNALLIILVWATGDLDDSPLFDALHIWPGVAALIFTVAQIGWHFGDRTPDSLPGLATWRKQAIHWNHWLIMLIALLASASGVGAWLGGDLFEEMHEFMALPLILLFLMHVAGVFLYQFTKGDSLGRMGVKFFSRS